MIIFSIFMAYRPPPELTPGPYVSEGILISLKQLMSRHMLDAGIGAGVRIIPHNCAVRVGDRVE